MKVLLRDVITGLYLSQPETWTAEAGLAVQFRHSAEAMDCARAYGLAQVEVVLAFEETRHSVALPLPGPLQA